MSSCSKNPHSLDYKFVLAFSMWQVNTDTYVNDCWLAFENGKRLRTIKTFNIKPTFT